MKDIKNIIFVIADTLRANNVGIYGANPSPTPITDKVARRGIVFANAYTTITKSDPSITAIMSGRFPMSTGLISHGRWIIKDQERRLKEIPMLAEILRKNGFATAAIDYFSRWHTRGYSYVSGKIIPDVDQKKIAGRNLEFLEYLRLLDLLSYKLLSRDFFARFYYCFFPKVIVPYDPADVVIDRAIKVHKKYKRRKLFLYIHLRDPHYPYIRPLGLGSFLFDSIEDRYNAEIRFLDEQIGRLLEYLRIAGELDNTLFILTADHGESLGEHNVYLAHHDPYELVVKIPLIFYGVDLGPKKIDAFVQNIDIFPTILELLDIDKPRRADGISLTSLISGRSKKGRDSVFFDDNLFGEFIIKKSRRKLGIRYRHYKYIKTLTGAEKDLFSPFPINTQVAAEELYDLDRDPEEKNNIHETNRAISAKIESKLQAHIDALRQAT